MRKDKYLNKLKSIEEKGDRGKPLAEIEFYGQNPDRVFQVVIVISDDEAELYRKEKISNDDNGIVVGSHFNKELLDLIQEYGVKTLRLDRKSRACHETMDSMSCLYWRNRERLKSFNLTKILECGLMYDLRADNFGGIELSIFKPIGVGGNSIPNYLVYTGPDDDLIGIDSPVFYGYLKSEHWRYGVRSGYAPGPGPDGWSDTTESFDFMLDKAIEYYFSKQSVMKRIPIYDLKELLKNIAQLKRNKCQQWTDKSVT